MELQGKNELLREALHWGQHPAEPLGPRVFLTSGGQLQLLDDVRAPTVRHDGGPAIHVTISLICVAVLAIKGCDEGLCGKVAQCSSGQLF